MTKQEAFDRVWQWFAVEKRPLSASADLGCAYRGDDGARCAVGIFIPDAEYASSMEGQSFCIVVDRCPSLAALPSETQSLLETLQDCHDTAENRSGLVRKLRELAAHEGLRVPGKSRS